MADRHFIRDFTEYCAGTEIPWLFALWSGAAGVSAALGRRVWIDRTTFRIYPNLYVVFVAGAGRCRKSTTINLLEPLLARVEPAINLIASKITPEALHGAMIRGVRDHIEPSTGEKIKVYEGFAVADELTNFLNARTYEGQIVPMLTKLFDCSGLDYETKLRGLERLRNPCLGLLGGTTLNLIRSAIPPGAVGDGLTSRILFIYVLNRPAPVAIPPVDPKRHEKERVLVETLNEIRKLTGPVVLSPEAEELYVAEYNRFDKVVVPQILDSYASRRMVHIEKLAMLIACAGGEKRVVSATDFEAATRMLVMVEKDLERVMMLIASSETGVLQEIINGTVIEHPEGIGYKELLRVLSHRVNARAFEDLVGTLVASGQVRRVVDAKGTMFFPSKPHGR